MYKGSTRVIDCTLDEVVEYVKSSIFPQSSPGIKGLAPTTEIDEDNRLYGIRALADFLNVHYTTANNYVKAGKFKTATLSSSSKKLIFLKDKVIEVMQQRS